jgi:hypothetical protein
MIVFAAATGLRPAEWIGLEKRDVDREARAVCVRRAFTRRELKRPKTDASLRAVPLQARALDALEQAPANGDSTLLFPGDRGGYLDIHHFRPFQWRPAQLAVGITPLRRIYDLRHTFATFALRAGISTFDLSRYMGASLTMIDRHYGHLARDGREHAIQLLDALNMPESAPWTLRGRRASRTTSAPTTETAAKQGRNRSPLTDSNRRPPPYHGTSQATGGNRSQRIRLVSVASGPIRFATDCHWLRPRGSIKMKCGGTPSAQAC